MVLSTCEYSPGELVFGQDMIFGIKAEIDWNELTRKLIRNAKENNKQENKKLIEHTYKKGDLVILFKSTYKQAKGAKLDSPTEGPYKILKVYSNGTVRIQRKVMVMEIINICRIRPYNS